MITSKIAKKCLVIGLALFLTLAGLWPGGWIQKVYAVDDWIKITDAAGLNAIRSNLSGHYRLMADINLNGANWIPIASNADPFTGILDGNSKVITGITISDTITQDQGLFSVIGASGEVMNLGIKEANITAGDYSGILAGTNSGTVSRCYVMGNITGKDFVGGLIGNNAGVVKNSFSSAFISGNDYIGGLIGSNSGTVSNSYSSSEMEPSLFNNYLQFDGIDGHITIPNIDAYETDTFTLEAWFQWDPANIDGDAADVQFIVGKGFEMFEIHTEGGSGSNGIRFIPIPNVGGDSWLDVPNAIQSGWFHVAAVYDYTQDEARVYINGVAQELWQKGEKVGTAATLPRDANPLSGNKYDFSIGMRSGGSLYFNGKISDVRFWNIARTAEQIAADKNKQLTGNETGLIGYWKLNEADGVIANDSCTNNLGSDLNPVPNNGTLAGGVTRVQEPVASHKGGLVGENTGTVANSFYDSDISSQSDTGKGEPETTENMKLDTTFSGWDYDTIWGIDPGTNSGYPYLRPTPAYAGGNGSKETPFQISNLSQLTLLAQQVNTGYTYAGTYFELTDDIYLTGVSWIPVGYMENSFNGYFDGNFHTLHDLTVSTAGGSGTGTHCNAGLFGTLGSDGILSNINLNNVDITSTADYDNYVGSLVGYQYGRVINCSAVGGSISLTGTRNTAGGLVGMTNGANAQLINSFANVSVSVTGTDGGWAGGLVGCGGGGALTANCFARGSVSNGGPYKGGLIGENYGNISNCYSTSGDAFWPVARSTPATGFLVVSNSTYYFSDTDNQAAPAGYSGITSTGGTLKSGGFINILNVNRSVITGLIPSDIVLYNWAEDTGNINDGYPVLVAPPENDVSSGVPANAAYAYSGGDGTTLTTPYLIATKEDLTQLAVNINSGTVAAAQYYKLNQNIDLAGGVWTPIGISAAIPFKGQFDFNGNQITNYAVNPNISIATQYGGLFGYVSGGTITGYNTPPSAGSILINNGAATAFSHVVTLTLSASDAEGDSLQMCFSNDNLTWSPWEAYKATGNYTLPAGAGNKTVYAKFRDTSNAISAVCSSSINVVIPNVTASSGTATFSGSSPVSVDPDITVGGDTLDGTKVMIKNYFTGDVLGYTGVLPAGVTAAWNGTTGLLTFTGSASVEDYQALLRTVTFYTTSQSTDPRTITFSLGQAVSSSNGHYYEFIQSGLNWTWTDAKANASTRSYFGMQGYLATITGSEENELIRQRLQADAWIGASDDYTFINEALGVPFYANQTASEGRWYWVTGPEAGDLFSIGNTYPALQPGKYMNWNNLEPNNTGSTEHYGEIYSTGSVGRWNDLPNTSKLGYLVEYGGMPGDPVLQLSSDKLVNFATYQLTYEAGANGSISGASSQTVNYGANGTAVTAVPAVGYHFVSWSDGVLTANRTDMNVTGNIHVSAAFSINQYTVTYNTQGGSAVTGITADHGSLIAVPADPTREGYSFDRWYKEVACTNEWYFTTDTVIGNITLYAKWIPVSNSRTRNGDEDTDVILAQADFTYGIGSGSPFSKIMILSLPAHGVLKLNNSNVVSLQEIPAGDLGELKFSPDSNWNGTSSFTWKGSDGSDYSLNTAILSMIIAPVNDAPVASDGNLTANADEAGNGTLLAADLDGDALTYSVIDQGSKGTVTITNSETGAYTYTPNAGEIGNDSFTYKVSDGKADSNAATVTVTIIPSGVADLSSLNIDSGSLSPAFAANTMDYTVNVENSTTVITVTPVAQINTATVTVNGNLLSGGHASIILHVGSNPITVEVTAQDGITQKIYAINVTRSGATPAATPDAGAGTGNVDLLVNGQAEKIGTSSTAVEGENTIVTISVDENRLERELEQSGDNSVLTVPFNNEADIYVGELNGQMVKSMEGRQAIIEVRTGLAAYTLPARQIDIDAVSEQLGTNVVLKDIKVRIAISEPNDETVKIVENSANAGEFTIVAPPVEFTVSCVYEGRIVEVSSFVSYIERTVAIPEGVDPGKITTGVVMDPDGTVRHVPTKIAVINGKYYAKINSLTNSVYTVVWNPVDFKDVANHWAKEAVNDMGSRMIIDGTGADIFSPDLGMTREEFAAVIVKALGLKPGMGTNAFSDIDGADSFGDYIKTAYEYELISGYGNSEYGPMDNITREQAMVIVAKAMSITGLEVELKAGEGTKLLAAFYDADSIDDYAREAVAACIKTGVVSGRSGKYVAPQENITRAEVAALVRMLLQKSGLI